jgi:hypothetical protein
MRRFSVGFLFCLALFLCYSYFVCFVYDQSCVFKQVVRKIKQSFFSLKSDSVGHFFGSAEELRVFLFKHGKSISIRDEKVISKLRSLLSERQSVYKPNRPYDSSSPGKLMIAFFSEPISYNGVIWLCLDDDETLYFKLDPQAKSENKESFFSPLTPDLREFIKTEILKIFLETTPQVSDEAKKEAQELMKKL